MQVQSVQNNQSFNGKVVVLDGFGKGSLEHIAKDIRKMDFVKDAKCDVYIKDFRNLILGKKDNWIGVVATKKSNPERVPLWLWQESKTKNKKNILNAVKSAIANPDPDVLHFKTRYGALERYGAIERLSESGKSENSLIQKVKKFLSSIINK
jgi:hypothetical protein